MQLIPLCFNVKKSLVKDCLVYGTSKMHEDMKRLSNIQSGAGVGIICTKLGALISYGHGSKVPKIQAEKAVDFLKYKLKCSA